jgi:ABC-2 type transport system ATP-binding protein
VGYLPENTPLYEEMGVVEYLEFMGQLQGVAPPTLKDRVDKLIDLCQINRMAHKDIGELSKGFRQRVGLAQALLGDPPVLILDEPTSGLDPGQIVEIRALIQEIAKEKCILLSTHILPEAQNTCNRILIINQGRLVGEGTPAELLSLAQGSERYTVSVKGKPAASVSASFSRLPRVSGVELLSENGAVRLRLNAEQGADLNEKIFDLAVSEGLKLLELSRQSVSLEDVFLKLTGVSSSAEQAHMAAPDSEPAAAQETAAAAGSEGESDE